MSAISEVESQLEQLPAYVEARRILSCVQGVGALANVDIDAMSDPHELRDLDFAILPGQLGVAENGAVWVDGRAQGLQLLDEMIDKKLSAYRAYNELDAPETRRRLVLNVFSFGW